MGFMIREITEGAKLTDAVTLEALETAVPHTMVRTVVTELGVTEQRTRKLPAHIVVLLAIAMNLFTQESLAQVLVKMMKGLRLIWPDPEFVPASKGAITQARDRLGARPLVELFRRVCQPLATKATPGAFLFDLRLMAIDGTREDIPDTSANASVFGRPKGPRGEGAFPQVQCIYLAECGTHAIVDAGFWPCYTNERVGAQRMLRSVTKEMLVMWDRGLHSFDMASNTRQQGAHFLSRAPAHLILTPIKHLPDGSYLAHIRPSDPTRRKQGECLLIRVIAYTIDDPNRPGHAEQHRLITSLVDPEFYSALDLACAYHERWEIEVTVDEIDTHQRLANHPLRSQKPVGIIQELYGLLIAHYVIRAIMHDAALAEGLDPDRLSFVNALHIIRDSITEFQLVAPVQHPALYQRLLRDIARHQLPERANRTNPRVVKRKMSKFRRKRPEHYRWPQPSKTFRDAVALLI